MPAPPSTLRVADLNEFKRICFVSPDQQPSPRPDRYAGLQQQIFLWCWKVRATRVNDLYARLMRDPRHHTITMLGYKEIEERHWSNWSMDLPHLRRQPRCS
jgi:hypothetical protein